MRTLLLLCAIIAVTSVHGASTTKGPERIGSRPIAPSLPPNSTEVDLGLDRAGVRFFVDVPTWPLNLTWYVTYSYCYHCILTPVTSFIRSSDYWQLDSRWLSSIELRNSDGNVTYWSYDYHFGQHGLYTFNITQHKNGNVTNTDLYQDVAPTDPFIAIYSAIGIFTGVGILWVLGTRVWHNYQTAKNKRLTHDSRESLLDENVSAEQSARAPTPAKRRLSSLDTFRGLSLAIMIFVNYGGGGYWFLAHSFWNGLTVADLVFPWFIWMMGVSMALSTDSLIKKKTSKIAMTTKVIRRSIILFWLGLFINNGFDTSHWRIPGVLQRFGVSYFVVGLILTWAPRAGPWAKTQHLQQQSQTSFLTYFDDITGHWVEWLLIASILLIHTCITFLLPVPDCPTGYIGAGGWSDYGLYPNCVGGAAKYIDLKMFGLHHMYDYPTCRDPIHCGEYDPEGALGCLTSIVITYLGVQSGRILVYYKQHKDILIRWFLWAVGLGIIVLILTKGGTQNDGVIPVNKNLWSMSFIFALACMANIGLSICYILVDLTGIWNGAPFRYTGMNSIIIYCGSELLDTHFPFAYKPPSDNVHGPLLVCHLIGVGSWLILGYYMYIHNFFIAI